MGRIKDGGSSITLWAVVELIRNIQFDSQTHAYSFIRLPVRRSVGKIGSES